MIDTINRHKITILALIGLLVGGLAYMYPDDTIAWSLQILGIFLAIILFLVFCSLIVYMWLRHGSATLRRGK